MMSEKVKTKKWEINWSAEKIMSISALCISVISVIALFYQLSLAREENELIRKQQSASVIPYLQFENIYNVRAFSIHLINKGVGPAFIKKVSFMTKDSVKFDNSTSALLHIVREKNSKDHLISYSGSITVKENTVLQSGESIRVFEISSTSNDVLTGVENFKNHMNNTPPEFSILYEDVYGNQWELTNKNNRQDFQFLTPTLVKKTK